MTELPNIAVELFDIPTASKLSVARPSDHAPRILLLYGSLRERSYSKLLTLEAQRLLQAMGAETRVFDPAGLPQPDGAPDSHAKCKNCGRLRPGPKVWSGLRPSGTAP